MPIAPNPLPTFAPADELLRTLLDISLTAVQLLQPLYGPDGETINDFHLTYLNPAAQHLMGLGEQPNTTLLTRFPDVSVNGTLEFYRRTYLSGAADTFQFKYPADEHDNFFHLAAQRCAELLLVSFTDTREQPSTLVEATLRQSQADEQGARAEAEGQRQRFYEVLQQLPAQVAIYHGPEHVFTFVNTQFRSYVEPAALLGRPVREASRGAVGEEVFHRLDHVYTSGQAVSLHELPVTLSVHQPARPEPVYVNAFYLPLRDAQGRMDGVLDFSYNVTEQVQARQHVQQLNQELVTLNKELRAANEELQANNAALLLSEQALVALNQELETRVLERTQALHANQQQLEQLFMQAPAPIVILDGPTHVYQLVNPAYQYLFPDRALLGKPVLEALPELAGSPLVAIWQQVYQMGQPYVASEMPLRLVRREGGPLEDSYWAFVYQPRRNERGEIDGILVFAHEVTEQVQARQAIEHNARQLQLLTDALPVLIGYLDRERRYRFANEAYRAWFNQDPAALLGQHVREVVGEKAYAATCGYMDRALAGERLDFEAKMSYREDFTKYIRTSYIPDVRGGQVVGFYTLVNDITEQVLAHQQVHKLNKELQVANEELQHSNAKLRRTNTDLDTFVYAASHDLRSPIVNIVGLLDLLRHQLLETHDPMLLRLVGMMEESITRFQQTVDHLSTIAHLQNESEQAKEKVELAQVIDDIRLDLLPLLESTNATLQVDVGACPTLHFSPKDLRSILFNLLSNAMKYHAPDRVPLVQVRAYCSANHFVLEVQDNGLGLDEKQQSKLFAMFRRLHTHVEGSGVGLYLIKRLIENADGTITVQSQVGVGSTFTVTLPLT